MTRPRVIPSQGEKSQSQIERSVEAAHELGADEDEAAFKAKLAVIARQKAKDEGESRGEVE